MQQGILVNNRVRLLMSKGAYSGSWQPSARFGLMLSSLLS